MKLPLEQSSKLGTKRSNDIWHMTWTHSIKFDLRHLLYHPIIVWILMHELQELRFWKILIHLKHPPRKCWHPVWLSTSGASNFSKSQDLEDPHFGVHTQDMFWMCLRKHQNTHGKSRHFAHGVNDEKFQSSSSGMSEVFPSTQQISDRDRNREMLSGDFWIHAAITTWWLNNPFGSDHFQTPQWNTKLFQRFGSQRTK